MKPDSFGTLAMRQISILGVGGVTNKCLSGAVQNSVLLRYPGSIHGRRWAARGGGEIIFLSRGGGEFRGSRGRVRRVGNRKKLTKYQVLQQLLKREESNFEPFIL